jgi:hypothetical protein
VIRLAAIALIAVSLGAAGCGESAASVPASPTPQASLSGSIALARGQIQQALAVRQVQLQTPQTAYRPPETPAFAAAPRAVVQAVLPTDPQHGYIVIYEFPDAAAAAQAATAEAAYVASGPGRVQFLLGTQFVMRQLGSTIVFFAWLPGDSADPMEPAVAQALETIGIEIPVPS